MAVSGRGKTVERAFREIRVSIARERWDASVVAGTVAVAGGAVHLPRRRVPFPATRDAELCYFWRSVKRAAGASHCLFAGAHVPAANGSFKTRSVKLEIKERELAPDISGTAPESARFLSACARPVFRHRDLASLRGHRYRDTYFAQTCIAIRVPSHGSRHARDTFKTYRSLTEAFDARQPESRFHGATDRFVRRFSVARTNTRQVYIVVLSNDRVPWTTERI